MANIAAIDYDPGASEVNQLNRIKLMLATANKNAARRQRKKESGKSASGRQKTGRSPVNSMKRILKKRPKA